MSQTKQIRYNIKQRSFSQAVHQRVEQYFKSNKLAKTGGWRVVPKTVAAFAVYLIPYFLMLFGVVTSWPGLFAMGILMGLGMAFIGLSVMHDANHGSYSASQKVNLLVSYSLNFLGGHYLNWRIQHNTLHHTFTNIHEHDEDIAPVGVLRFSPHAPLKKIHRFQFIYAWFFYSLMTVMWVTTKDYKQLNRYDAMGLIKQSRTTYWKHFIIMTSTKILYYVYLLAIPIMFMAAPWWIIVLVMTVMLMICGLILAIIFQPAHVIEDTSFPLPDSTGNMENDWAVHQLYTTANFAPRNKLLTWFVGGLNYQVEHHLFPAISHIHYPKISQIVREVASEFNYPYHSHKTFIGAVASHTRTLIRLGREPAAA
jgi:linoleoyl-CoA desaturase